MISVPLKVLQLIPQPHLQRRVSASAPEWRTYRNSCSFTTGILRLGHWQKQAAQFFLLDWVFHSQLMKVAQCTDLARETEKTLAT